MTLGARVSMYTNRSRTAVVQPGVGNRLVVLMLEHLRFFRRQCPRGVEREAVGTNTVHAEDPRTGKERDDVDSHGRHVAIVVVHLLTRRFDRQVKTGVRSNVTYKLGDHALSRCADKDRIAVRDDAL